MNFSHMKEEIKLVLYRILKVSLVLIILHHLSIGLLLKQRMRKIDLKSNNGNQRTNDPTL
jgi:hypothetical protein